MSKKEEIEIAKKSSAEHVRYEKKLMKIKKNEESLKQQSNQATKINRLGCYVSSFFNSALRQKQFNHQPAATNWLRSASGNGLPACSSSCLRYAPE